jgi:pimeloyl-ACP methyl ester carboxylesterase
MDVTTSLRLAACGGILAMLIASTVFADEVRIESGTYTLNGDFAGQHTGGRVVLIVHGTLGHKDMEVIEALQSVFMESGQASLAINLSLNMDDREGFFPCDALHTHQYSDAVDEIEAWIRWLTEQGTNQIVLLGHSRGANQVVKHVLQGVRSAQMAILLAPPATTASKDVLQIIDSGSTGDTLEGIDFLHCKNANVLASTYLSYYGPAADNDTIALLQKVSVPTLVLSGSRDEIVPNLAARMSGIANPLVTHIEISNAGHFFRDLYMYDVVDSVIEFMRRLPRSVLIAPAVSLQDDGMQSQATGQPLLVFVSQKDCQFCKRLRKQVLLPMIRAGELEGKVIVREVSLDSGYSLEDFDGVEIAGREFAARYNAFVTPTLLLLDGRGESLTEPLVGTPNLELYAFYLHKAIETATNKL